MTIMTMIRDRHILVRLAVLLAVMTAAVQWAWAADDTFTVTNTTGADLLYKGNTLIPTGGTYTTLTLGLAADEGKDVFKIENGGNCITYAGDGFNPTITDSKPTGGHVYVFTTTKPGEFVFEVKLNDDKTIHFRNTLGTDLNVRKNTSGKNIDNYKWAVTVETAGTYYLYADGSKLPFYGYTFTRKVPTGITSLPYHADFGSNIEPFDDGNNATVASTNSVFTINSVAPNSGTAIARFNGVHTLASTEQVTLSFTAYHGYYSKGESKVTLYNSDDVPLISYTYGKTSGNVTNVAFNEVTDNDFAAFNARSHYSGDSNANGFGGNGRPFTNTAADNPVVTMTVAGSGLVTFNLTRGYGSVSQSFNELLDGVKMDLAYIKIEDNSDNADRGLGIDNLKITSQLASLDYETGVVDWTTSTGGRFDPVIMNEGGNYYLSVNQSTRNQNQATLTNTTLNGSVPAGGAYTISFDMKIGNGNTEVPSFTIKDASNTGDVFEISGASISSTEWKINDSETVTLTGTTTNTSIESLVWYHYTVSYTNGYTYVSIDSNDGITHYLRKGFVNSSAGGLGKLVFSTGRYNANFAIDNIKVVPYASTAFSQDGKVETYTIMGAGDLPQKDEGNTITIEYGTTNEVQMTEQLAGTEYFGSYAVDKNVSGRFSQAYGTGSSMVGTFYKLTPKYNGKLTISGWVNVVNNITITDAAGTIIDDWKSAGITANSLFTHEFTTTLIGGNDYFLYGCAPNTVNTGTANEGTDNYAILHLTGFTFTQDAMNRQVNVSDLLYEAGKSDEALKRIIPGFELEYSAGVTSSADHQSLAFTNDSKLTVTLRQNGYSATVSSVTLVGSDGANIATGYTVDTSVAGKATVTATTNLENVAAFIIGYTADDAQSYKLWLNEDKENIDDFSFANGHVMRVPGDNRTFSQTPTFGAGSSYYVPNFAYKSSNTSVATINTDGSNGQLRKAGSVTITATFAETDYFLSKSATYTVDNVLRANETYDVDVANDKILRIGAYADVASTALSLSGGKTSASSFTYGTTLEKLYTRTTSDGTVTLKNETVNNITINTLQVITPHAVAWLYYEGQEENYSEQLVFQSFPSGPVKGFRVLDIGDPTDPIDLTEAYSLESGEEYVWTDGTHVKTGNLGGSFNTKNGGFTVSGKASGDETTLPKVSHILTKTGTADGYADDITAESNIYVATPTIDGDDTYYYAWDMTTSVSSSGQLDSRWRWDAHGYYQAWMPEYLPILNNSGKTLAGNEGLLVKGDLRYHTGSTGLRMNLTSVNAHLKFPVKAGMEVKIVMASAAADIEHIISNVTTVKGDATNSLYIEQAGVNTPITAYYLAKADGAIEIHSMDKMGGYIKSITLQVPRIHFNEEIITVRTIKDAIIANQTVNTGDAEITYSIEGSYDLDGTAASTLATVPNDKKNEIKISTTDEGYVIVKAVNSSATGVQPKQGTYRIYMIDFGYTKASYDKDTDDDEPADGADFPSLDLASEAAKNNGGEALFDKRPKGYEKVVQPVTYTMSVVDGSPRGRLIQTTDSDPTKTTYKLSAYSAGTIRVTATTGRISTYTDVQIVGGNQFAEIAPTRRLTDLEKEGGPAAYYFLNELPAGFETGTTIYTVDKSGGVDCGAVTTIDDGTHYYAKIANITGYGAIRVTATNDNNTSDNDTDDKTASFILTVAYPASTGQKWDFYRKKHYDSSTKYGLYIGAIDEYNGDESQTATPNPRNVTSSTATQHKATGNGAWNSSWTTSTKWEKVYRKGNEQPRWAYAYSMRGDNAFIIEETAGLIIETGPRGFYTDNPVQPNEFAYNHIGLHNNASITIPKLKKGDYIALNLSRVLPNNGAILSATNVEDLAGNPVNHTFTISRSQIDYQNAGETVPDGDGARVIPGYYTFRTIADGDVTFTLADEGYLDVLSVEIYNDGYAEYSATRDPSNGYHYTMTDIKKDDSPTYNNPPAMLLKEDNATEVINLAICNVMNSTSVGPADYVLLDKKGTLNASLENVEWFSDGGALYNKGKITVRDGYGKILVRMNNYTAEGRYLIGYTPTYSLTVGNPPHQDYPFTWNFENISGGAVHGKVNNVYSSIQNDYLTWTNLGYETYKLDTNTPGGSLYVPGASLVTTDRSIGEKGTISELNTAGKGCDEFNGLGFNGSIVFKLAQQGETANDAPASVTGTTLLTYRMDNGFVDEAYLAQKKTEGDKTTWTSTELVAGNGHITFGSPAKREESTVGTHTKVYKMDGGNTKNVLLKPERAFKNGDHIILTGYSSANVEKSGFSFYANANDAASSALLTLNWGSHGSTATANTESTIDYTVTRGDGLSGRSEVYLFRADKANTVYLSEVSITGDASAPVSYKRALTCDGAVTITIPDLRADDYVYIKSSATPKTIPSNLTAAVPEDGLDATTNVYKYKVIAGGNANVTFANGTKIYRIGVTNIMKPLARVGNGDAWATESRNHAIDYTQTGAFTVNDIKANTVTAKNYGLQKLTVKMNEKTDAMPAQTGMVLKLKLKYTTDDEKSAGVKMTESEATTATTNAVANLAKANSSGVPLFYPPYSATILSSAVVGFGGSEGNLMKDNVASQTFDSETENVDAVSYTRFIFAKRYMQWKKENGVLSPTPTSFTESGDLPVFYRLHLYNSTEASALSSTVAELNTLGANKAYMLIRTGNVPKALWDTSSSARSFIGIAGVSDMGEITGITEHSERPASAKSSAIYDLRGQCMGNDESVLAPGIYIRNGKKFVIR